MGEATIRRPLMSGHCAVHGRDTPSGRESHARCAGAQRANPQGIFQPCPCPCHFPDPADMELFECGECGKIIIEATRWPHDEDDDVRYTHMDLIVNSDGEIIGGTGRALGEECGGDAPVSRNPQSRERSCSRCGDEFTPKGRERICGECRAAEQEEKDEEFDSVLADLEADLDEDFDAMLADLDFDDEDD